MTTVERPVAVVIIAIVNVMIYVAVLSWVLPFLITGLVYFGDFRWWAFAFYRFLGVAYSVAGIIGVVYLLRNWRSFRWTAITGYVFECVLFAIIGFIGLFGGYAYGIPGVVYHYQLIFGIIVFKIASIVYLARKKT